MYRGRVEWDLRLHTHTLTVLTSKWRCWVWEKCLPWPFQPYTTSTPFLFLNFSVCSSIPSFISFHSLLICHLISSFQSPLLFSLFPSVSGFLLHLLKCIFSPFHPIHHLQKRNWVSHCNVDFLAALWFNNLCEQKTSHFETLKLSHAESSLHAVLQYRYRYWVKTSPWGLSLCLTDATSIYRLAST